MYDMRQIARAVTVRTNYLSLDYKCSYSLRMER